MKTSLSARSTPIPEPERRSLLERIGRSKAASVIFKLFAGGSVFVNVFGPNKNRPSNVIGAPPPTTEAYRLTEEAKLEALASPKNVAYPGSILSSDAQQVPKTVKAEATRRMDERSTDGISASDLAAVEKALRAEHGDSVGVFALREVIAERVGKLDESAIDWLQNSHASMGGHVALLEHVLTSHLGKARLLDVNFDGKLDAGDVAWSKNAAGRVDIRAISAALADRVRIGAAVVSSCLEMYEAKHEFAIAPLQKFNSALWKRDGRLAHRATFHLRPGVRPSEAMNDIFARPDAYRFECASALVIVYYRAMQKLLGDSDFNRICGDLVIGPWELENDLARLLSRSGDPSKPASKERAAALPFGEYTYTKNWSVSWWGWAKGCQGQNQIRLADDLYYGHSYALVGQGDIVARENGARVLGSKTSASMTDRQERLDPKLFLEDREP